MFKSKAFAYNKFTVALTVQLCFDRIENIVGNGKRALYPHFLLFIALFSKGFFAINPFLNKPWFLSICNTALLKKTGGKKEEIAHIKAISPFLRVFSTRFENFMLFSSNLKFSSANSFTMEEFKCYFGKEYKFAFSYKGLV